METANMPTEICRILTGPLLIIKRTFDEKSATIPDIKLMIENARAITPEIEEKFYVRNK